MSILDLSATKCHPLQMPNCDSKDARLRLDCRTGASVDIFNSRVFVFGGSTLELNIPQNFTLDTIELAFNEKLGINSDNGTKASDFNFSRYLSAECFRLSLINRKWTHYKTSTTTPSEIPEARMFHAMCVYDNYIYISGGIKFDEDNQLEVLNDLWRFDSIDRQWKCIYENGNDFLLKRYDHIMLMLPYLELFDKSLVRPGICILGGVDNEGRYHQQSDLFDVSSLKCYEKRYPTLVEFRHSKQGGSEEETLKIRHSLNALHCELCPNTNDLRLFGFSKTPNLKEFEPILVFTNSSKGVRYSHNNNFNIKDISSLEFPTIGVFGENILVIGFIANQKKISSYVFNVRTDTWTKLQISCLHKIYTHKLSKGFVWESHHKIVFLGSMNMKDTAGSVDYFDNLVVMSLPFTNFFGKKAVTVAQKLRFSNSPSASSLHTFESESAKRANSVTSANSNLSHNRNNHPHSLEHTGDFAGYAYHVAQQMQVNSIKSVLPSYAIAIGKNAFERNTALADLDFICSDGNVIPVPLTLCRRRWGYGFDELFADACAKVQMEQRAIDLIESSRSSCCGSCDNDSDEYSSIGSKNNSSTPYFRYPFQDKNPSKNDISPIRGGRVGSLSANESRHSSVSGSLFTPTALNRASILLSQSRRNSLNIGQSRNSSISYLSPSRRNSLSNSVNSRRHSLGGGLQIAQPSSRRGSTLSRSSLLSTSSNSYNSSSSNPFSRQYMNTHAQSNAAFGSSPDGSGSAPISSSPALVTQPSSSFPIDTDSRSNSGINASFTLQAPTTINLENIPIQLPMPDVLPDGSPMPNLTSESVSRTLSHISTAEETFSKKNSIHSIANSSREELVDLAENSDFFIDPNTKFDAMVLPRALYLPYPRSTVHAIVEYLYSGQIGSNWRLFPTGIELLQATKQLGIPLLYDLILELFFVSLGIMEATLKAKLILYLEDQNNDPSSTFNDHIYNLLDVKGNDDFDLDWKLLLEAATGSRRDSGSTISSDMKLDNHEGGLALNQGDKDIDLTDLGPTDKIEAESGACDLSPTNTKFEITPTPGQDEGAEPKDALDDVEGHRVKITIDSLDENGYETTSDSEEGEEDEGNSGFLMKSFKRFTLDGTRLPPSGGGSHKKFKRWPTFKDLVGDENTTFLSATIIELFLETGALINDSKLMLQSIHVQELYKGVKEIQAKSTKTGAISEKPYHHMSDDVIGTNKAKEQGLTYSKSQDFELLTKSDGKDGELGVRSASLEGEDGRHAPKDSKVPLPASEHTSCKLASRATVSPEPGRDNSKDIGSSLRKSKSSISVLSTPNSLLRTTEGHNSSIGGIDETLSISNLSLRQESIPPNNDSSLSLHGTSMRHTGSGRSLLPSVTDIGFNSDDQSLYSVETAGEPNEKGEIKKKKRRNFFGRFKR